MIEEGWLSVRARLGPLDHFVQASGDAEVVRPLLEPLQFPDDIVLPIEGS